jgi:hypothetical protein
MPQYKKGLYYVPVEYLNEKGNNKDGGKLIDIRIDRCDIKHCHDKNICQGMLLFENYSSPVCSMASSMIEESNNCYRIITEKEYNRRQLK